MYGRFEENLKFQSEQEQKSGTYNPCSTSQWRRIHVPSDGFTSF